MTERARTGTDESSSENVGLVSIIIPNYNYARFVSQAIESALALDWPALEVIVVDDGSTDDSRAVIERYADRVRIVQQPNAGQATACNTGFALSRGNVVIFLDSDDLLEPQLLRELASVWRPGLSKVQFQMRVIDAQGRPTGALLPQFHVVPTSDDVRAWAARAGAYPCPPGSGNAYAREFLEKLFPLRGEDRAADSYCLAAAPHLGDVVTVAKPLVSYRVHGQNNGAMSELDRMRFGRELKRAEGRLQYARSIEGARHLPDAKRGLRRSLSVLPYRLASLRLLPHAHPLPADSIAKVLYDWMLASLTPQGLSWRARLMLGAWAAMVAVAPAKWAEPLILWRFASSRRPAALRRALGWFKVVRRQVAIA